MGGPGHRQAVAGPMWSHPENAMPRHPGFPRSALLIELVAGLFSPVAAADFPLKVSANRRHLVDRNGRPVLIQGEAAWSLITGVTICHVYAIARRGFGYSSPPETSHRDQRLADPEPRAGRSLYGRRGTQSQPMTNESGTLRGMHVFIKALPPQP